MVKLFSSSAISELYDVGGDDSALHSRKPRAVDLGAGCGLTSMALACAGFNVWSSDKAQLLPRLTSNLEDFKQACAQSGRMDEIGAIRPVELNWTAFDCSDTTDSDSVSGGHHLGGLCGGYPELLVCSDCLYSSSCIDPLLCVIEQVKSLDRTFHWPFSNGFELQKTCNILSNFHIFQTE